jgi:hypothetical protein
VFVKNAVAEEGFASKEVLEEQKLLIEELQRDLNASKISQAAIHTDVESVKSLQTESRNDIKKILSGIRRLETN